jgi:hypothetical protein
MHFILLIRVTTLIFRRDLTVLRDLASPSILDWSADALHFFKFSALIDAHVAGQNGEQGNTAVLKTKSPANEGVPVNFRRDLKPFGPVLIFTPPKFGNLASHASRVECRVVCVVFSAHTHCCASSHLRSSIEAAMPAKKRTHATREIIPGHRQKHRDVIAVPYSFRDTSHPPPYRAWLLAIL